MKKLSKFVFIIPFIVILGIAFIIIGSTTSNSALKYMGAIVLELGVPICMLTLVTAGIIMIMKSGMGDDKSEDESEEKSDIEKEYQDINEINESYGYESRMKEAEYLAEHTAKSYNNASHREKVLSFLLLGFLIGNIFLVIIFAFFRIYIGSLICVGLFAGTIVLCGVIKAILERASIRAEISTNYKDREILYGIVRACLLSSATSVGGERASSTTRITGVKYRIKIAADNKEYTAYSKEFYEEGAVVAFIVLRGRRASIVDAEKLENYLEERSSLLK